MSFFTRRLSYKDQYNELAHHVAYCSNPTMFHPITWVQSKETLATLISEYERSFVNWKMSGEHGGFGEANTDVLWERKPFSNFTLGINTLLYLQLFISSQMFY